MHFINWAVMLLFYTFNKMCMPLPSVADASHTHTLYLQYLIMDLEIK